MTNISLAGLDTQFKRIMYDRDQMIKPEFERNVKPGTQIKDVLDFCASAQFAAFYQISNKLEKVFQQLDTNSIDITGVHLVGGVARNAKLREIIAVACHTNDKMLLACPEKTCVDNGAIVAWNAWEIKNAEQDVDIRDEEGIEGVKKIPLGSFNFAHTSRKKITNISGGLKQEYMLDEKNTNKNKTKRSFLSVKSS